MADCFSRTLTTDAQNTVGTSGNDSFNALEDASLDDGDLVDGGAGTDTLSARYTVGAANESYSPEISNVEILYVRPTQTATGNLTWDVQANDDFTQLWSDRAVGSATATLTFDNIVLGTQVGVRQGDGNSDTTFTFKNATGAADVATLALDKADAGDVTIANIETLTITGLNGASTVDNLAASSVKTLTINADQAITVTASNVYEDAAVTITGSGAVTLGLEDAIKVTASAATGNVTLTGIDESENYNIVTGSGNDKFSTLGAALALLDTITAGTGTDTLVVNYNITDGILDNVTGIEVVEYQKQTSQSATADLSIDMDAFNGQAVSLLFTQASSTASFDDISVTNFVSGTTVTIQAKSVEATGVLTLTADTDSAASVTVVLNAKDADGVDVSSSSNDFNEIASLTVTSLLDTDVVFSTAEENRIYVGAGSDDLTTITIKGSAALQLTAAETAVASIDASEFTSTLTLGVVAAGTNVTIKGGSGSDTITVSATTRVSVTGGEGNDTIALGSTLDDNDVIDGGNGTDTVSFTVSGYNDNLRISNIETITVTDAAAATAASTIDLGGIAGLTTINLVGLTGGAATSNLITFDNVGSSLTTLILDASTATADDSVAISLDTDTSSDSLTIRVDMDGTEWDGIVTADDIENLTINFNFTTGGTALAGLAATASFADATSVTIKNTRYGDTSANYIAADSLSIAKLDVKSGATIDLTSWYQDIGITDTAFDNGTTVTIAASATATAVDGGTAGDFGVAGLTLVGADAVTIKLNDGRTETSGSRILNLGSSNEGVDKIVFSDLSSDNTNDIGAVIVQNFLARGSNSATNTTRIDLRAYGVDGLEDLNIFDGASAANGTNASSDVTFVFASGTLFAGYIMLIGVDTSNVTADNFIFA